MAAWDEGKDRGAGKVRKGEGLVREFGMDIYALLYLK